MDFPKHDEIFRITELLRDHTLKGENLLARLLNNFEPTAENVRALYVFAIERLDARLEPRVCGVCAQWLSEHGLPVPTDKPRSLFDEFLDEGLISEEDHKELMS